MIFRDHGMKIYTVHVKPGTPHSAEKPVFVKEGFAFFGFLIPAFWVLYKRLWLEAVAVWAVTFFLLYLADSHAVNDAGIAVLDIGFHVLVGTLGNDRVRSRLHRQGYIMTDIAASDNLLHAEQRYFERYLAAAA